jgi:hypothetical protein
MGYNGSLTFVTVPLEFKAFANLSPALRLGAGLRATYADMAGTGLSTGWAGIGTWESSEGTVVEAQYLFTPYDGKRNSQYGLSLRWVHEKFTRLSTEFNGDNYEVGLVLYY